MDTRVKSACGPSERSDRSGPGQRMREISHRSAAAIHVCRPDLDESQGGMKRVRFRVRRVLVDLAENLPVSGLRRMFEQILIESARAAAPACRCRDHDPVDIDKARIARAKPLDRK